MNLLSRNSDYAVQSLCYMYRRNTVVTVAEICAELHLPIPFTRGILQKLANGGIVDSIVGKGGGFRPKLLSNRVPVTRIVKIFHGHLQLTKCLFRENPCMKRSTCKLRAHLKDIEEIVVNQLEYTTIADLL